MMSNISLDEAIEAKENAEQEIEKIIIRLIELGLSVESVDIVTALSLSNVDMAVASRAFDINPRPIVKVKIKVTL